MHEILRESVLVGERELIIETGRVARQANGAVLVQYGETVVLVTVCAGDVRPDLPFFPLVCDYVEKTYSAGRIPGGFHKREGRLGEKETLTSRLIDRPIRPLFAKGYRNNTQIIATVLSMDQENDPDVLAITGASAALMISDLPFLGPIAGIRIGRIRGTWIANPTFAQREASDMDLVLVVSEDAIVMVEGEAQEISEEEFIQAMSFGQQALKEVLALQKRFAQSCGKPKFKVQHQPLDPEIQTAVETQARGRLKTALQVPQKLQRYKGLDALKKALVQELIEDFPDRESEITKAFDALKSKIMREMILNEGRRIDGRTLDQIRPISSEVRILPRVHGSALFTRGETQALTTVTLGSSNDEQRIDLLTGPETKRFMLHYNFPPFSVGEVRPIRGPGRREIGHGMLAERALLPMLPMSDPDSDYPYTIRLVSEILESNGSSSMATVCGGTLALMDAGVPIKRPVAGIAMGLIKEGERAAVLSDILGDEDHMGDMDFKVCGTAKGITAIQMDVKIAGIDATLMAKALEQARKGRLYILDKMSETLEAPRRDLSFYAPRIVSIKVNPNKIRDIIGAGGKTIRSISMQTGSKIDVQDDGTVTIAATNEESLRESIAIIEGLTREAKMGEVYRGIIKKIVDFGAFVEIFPGTDGLCHISEISDSRISNIRNLFKEGDEMIVKVIGIDRGKIKLSRKAALGERPKKF